MLTAPSSIVTLVVQLNVKRGRILGAPGTADAWRTWRAIEPRISSSSVVVGFLNLNDR
jgi:hypothetical protein